jgi:signal transduction histidine kinase/DNA-binding response OmpR family regulator
MKRILAIIFICTSIDSYTQDKQLDSLYSIVKNERLPSDTNKVKTLLKIAGLERSFDLKKSKEAAEDALKLSQKLGYNKGEGMASYSLGSYYVEAGEFERATNFGIEALRIFEELDYKSGVANCYSMFGRLHADLRNWEKALYYWHKSAELNELINNKSNLGYAYNGLGNIFGNLENFDSALYYHRLALKAREEIGSEKGISQSYGSLALVSIRQKKYDEAIQYDLKAMSIEGGTTPVRLATINARIGMSYMFKKDYANAEKYLSKSLGYAKKVGGTKMLLDITVNLSLLEEERGNHRKALEYERLRSEYKDSLFNEQKNANSVESEARFETEKKEQEIILLEQQAKNQTLWRNTLIGGLLFTLLAATAIYSLQRSRTSKAKLLLETQQQLNYQLQEADKIKSRFFANISHEFRTPLTLIISPIEEKLALKTLEQKEKILFQSIRRSANRLLELVNQLLELSKLESGFMKLQARPGNLHRFIMTILSSFDSLADVGQVHYTKEVRTTEATLLFDGDKLEKILNNLLSNAFKFSPKGAKVDVRVMAAEKEKKVELTFEVQNFGAAIATENLNRIFEPFYQGDNMPVRGVQGTGLGLSLVKELVKLHGGEIHAASSEAKGTVFTVTMVFDKSDVTDIANINSSSSSHFLSSQTEVVSVEAQNTEGSEWSVETPTTGANTDNAKETILIVEDNQDVRNLVRQGLEANYTILEAATGKEGGALANENAVDLVVSDVMMPVMSGVELCHLLKNDERTSHIPIILLTARADHESKLEGLRTGADDYLVKPFNMQELQARVFNLIEQRKKLVQKYDKHIVVQPHEITVTPLDERLIQRVIQAVEKNLDDSSFSTDKMSEEVGMSRTNLHKKLKAITGLATSEFIQDFRLRRAAQLIEKKADSISQIGYMVGFNDKSYFTKCFKKKFGKVPSEWNGNARHPV